MSANTTLHSVQPMGEEFTVEVYAFTIVFVRLRMCGDNGDGLTIATGDTAPEALAEAERLRAENEALLTYSGPAHTDIPDEVGHP